MTKKPRPIAGDNDGQVEADRHEDKAPEELFRYATLQPSQIINGHRLTVGTVIELTKEEAEVQRAGGVALDDVHAEDKREVYSVRDPYVAKDESE